MGHQHGQSLAGQPVLHVAIPRRVELGWNAGEPGRALLRSFRNSTKATAKPAGRIRPRVPSVATMILRKVASWEPAHAASTAQGRDAWAGTWPLRPGPLALLSRIPFFQRTQVGRRWRGVGEQARDMSRLAGWTPLGAWLVEGCRCQPRVSGAAGRFRSSAGTACCCRIVGDQGELLLSVLGHTVRP